MQRLCFMTRVSVRRLMTRAGLVFARLLVIRD
jgi:hypothetical protein